MKCKECNEKLIIVGVKEIAFKVYQIIRVCDKCSKVVIRKGNPEK